MLLQKAFSLQSKMIAVVVLEVRSHGMGCKIHPRPPRLFWAMYISCCWTVVSYDYYRLDHSWTKTTALSSHRSHLSLVMMKLIRHHHHHHLMPHPYHYCYHRHHQQQQQQDSFVLPPLPLPIIIIMAWLLLLYCQEWKWSFLIVVLSPSSLCPPPI